MSSCEGEKGIEINNIEQTDSISVQMLNSKQKAKVIKSHVAIAEITELLENHTHRELSKFWVKERVTLYINGRQEFFFVLGNHIKYNGEYVCDENLEKILSKYIR
jgi:hypothetical protein